MKKTQGFTLVEIMIVVAIIGILAAIAIPNFVRNRNQSQANACISNMKQIQGACEMVAMRGETPSNDNIANEIKGFASLACPAKKDATYEIPEADGEGNYNIECPAELGNQDPFPHKLPAAE